ncbi:CTP:molybdopterin cytidylyltransferase [Actinomycetales bacterium JB111]|nr:CTP:molybdopterin cytidylyltransferase [Actinomycetales bacterium JB111]
MSDSEAPGDPVTPVDPGAADEPVVPGDAVAPGGAATVGLLLAAGAGRRYGRPKILVPGWLEHAVEALVGGGCDRVLVVTGAARAPMPLGAVEVHCADWDRGIGASLAAGLRAVAAGAAEGRMAAAGDAGSAGAEAGGTGPTELLVRRVAIHLVDYPDIAADTVRRVLDAAGDHLARATFDGRARHPVVVPADHLPGLLAALTDDDGAAPYLRGRQVRPVECGDLATGEDVDRPTPRSRPVGRV